MIVVVEQCQVCHTLTHIASTHFTTSRVYFSKGHTRSWEWSEVNKAKNSPRKNNYVEGWGGGEKNESETMTMEYVGSIWMLRSWKMSYTRFICDNKLGNLLDGNLLGVLWDDECRRFGVCVFFYLFVADADDNNIISTGYQHKTWNRNIVNVFQPNPSKYIIIK